MKPANIFLPAALLAIALAACQQQSDDNIAIDETNTANAEVETLPPDEAAANDVDEAQANEAGNAESAQPSPSEASTIPGQYRGRWGMVAADCEPGRSDAKGLLVIGDKTLRFYESVGTLKEQRPAIATSFAGLFAFTGEGQSWQKVITFTRTGDTLKRAEKDGTFTYQRCS
jgi:hypothetical protein